MRCGARFSPASLAIRFAACLEQVKVVLSGMSTAGDMLMAALLAGKHNLSISKMRKELK